MRSKPLLTALAVLSLLLLLSACDSTSTPTDPPEVTMDTEAPSSPEETAPSTEAPTKPPVTEVPTEQET